MIGANCVEALEPKEVISNREREERERQTETETERDRDRETERDAYVVKYMVGPIAYSSKNGDKVSCNGVPVEKAGSQNLGKHHFCVIYEVKDTGIKDMLNKIYHVDFTESVQQ